MTRRHILLSLFVIAAMITGCDGTTTSPATGGYPKNQVDIRFREFYERLGGENVLGPVISEKFGEGGHEYQYTATVLMVYLPDADDNQRYQLAPIGMELGVAEPPMNPDSPSGHEVYPAFLDFYNELGGTRYTGVPITEAHYNADKGRIEQFFENVGIYHLEADFKNVRLLHYGAWKCGDYCNYNSPEEATVMLWSSVGTSFNAAVQRLDPTLTGYPLTETYTASDGVLEQIFENVVIIADVNNPGNIRLRPILGMIGIPVLEPGDYFIPEPFKDYIDRNSGLEFTGRPVTEYTGLSSEVFRQCFSNLCLDYFPNAPKGFDVRPAPLGYTYKSLYYLAVEQQLAENRKSEMTLRVWETHPLLSNSQKQEIGLRLESGQKPLENFEPILTLHIPGMSDIVYKFPPTNQDGTSYLVLDPINVSNGTRIEYQVCVKDLHNVDYCINDDFMIWIE